MADRTRRLPSRPDRATPNPVIPGAGIATTGARISPTRPIRGCRCVADGRQEPFGAEQASG